MNEGHIRGGAGLEALRVIRERRSCRAFLDQPVALERVHEILDVARFAPSGTNTQPWRVDVVSGVVRDRLVAVLESAFDDPARDEKYKPPFSYYPAAWWEPYLGRRRQLGWALYARLGIEKGESARMHAQHRRNMRFFDAPVGLFFTVDSRLAQGSWLDCGMFIQNVMLAAQACGLATCPQAAFLPFHELIREVLGWADGQTLVCGMSLGHADPHAPENSLAPERVAVDEFARFLG